MAYWTRDNRRLTNPAGLHWNCATCPCELYCGGCLESAGDVPDCLQVIVAGVSRVGTPCTDCSGWNGTWVLTSTPPVCAYSISQSVSHVCDFGGSTSGTVTIQVSFGVTEGGCTAIVDFSLPSPSVTARYAYVGISDLVGQLAAGISMFFVAKTNNCTWPSAITLQSC